MAIAVVAVRPGMAPKTMPTATPRIMKSQTSGLARWAMPAAKFLQYVHIWFLLSD